jgi:UDP-N-acetylmuramoyl-tripeptide--D-alanyl-D-alanine ligase
MVNYFERWLGACAAKTIRREKPLIIAVTGSVGKSSTKQAIAAILDGQDESATLTRVSAKNYNNELGVPLTIFGLAAPGRSPFAWMRTLWTAWTTSVGIRRTGIRTFVIEMGADKPGDIARLVAIAPPDIAVITAVTPEDPSMAPVHTANYPSIDAVAEEKATLVKALKPEGTAILNADDKRVFAMRHLTEAHALTFGEADGTDIRLVKTQVMMDEGPHGMIPTGLEIHLESLNILLCILIGCVFCIEIVF